MHRVSPVAELNRVQIQKPKVRLSQKLEVAKWSCDQGHCICQGLVAYAAGTKSPQILMNKEPPNP